ncbi:DUF2997 domain-containing protein [Actinomyces sp. 2119]|uniref:DUF2997 domain-containing protein n=1 Tax=Actinomyces lilanjuaniae TaxID=2321394 RepID=A0ABN5PQG2_9ACTO|nr:MULTISPECIES: DUF2997 domain-containing protein [Actinomyces]AYD90640.1 DUF2997 domain-containing protein [Actinomyces lilanjuaniae]RJF43896.1 DUF2997 domain-containing protein [Actinomyces sp. 2119]
MSARRYLKVSVGPDGTVDAETIGFVGSSCLPQVGVLEDILEAVATESAFTADYYAAQGVSQQDTTEETTVAGRQN